ncbi:hypothetical protein NQ318_019122 [Aromia moschata]|uniref:Transposase n=1 Tax=Aromia moschata TaxID=1265417 RepID=A0AAV8YR52_9CUCU|nr:hypothetical protein NQ318_019122 [Aromia moschata]
MKRIITGDEIWTYEYDIQTSRQSWEWRYDDEPKSKKRGVVHSKFLPEGQTVIKEYYYLGILRRLRESIRRKRPELWKENYWILHDDNADHA